MPSNICSLNKTKNKLYSVIVNRNKNNQLFFMYDRYSVTLV